MRQYTNEQLILELIKRNGISNAPIRTIRYGDHYQSIIAIDKDHSAHLTLTDDDFSALKNKEMNMPECKLITIITSKYIIEFSGFYRRDLEKPNWHYYETERGDILHFRKYQMISVLEEVDNNNIEISPIE